MLLLLRLRLGTRVRPRPPAGLGAAARRAASSSTSSSSVPSSSQGDKGSQGHTGLQGETGSQGDKGSHQLVREFVHEALYSPVDGYFGAKGQSVIISPSVDQRIPFASLKGYWDYQLALDKLYKSKASAWMTPVEIFAPHYSQALARYILEAHAKEAAEGPLAYEGDDEEEDEEDGGYKKVSTARRRRRALPRREPLQAPGAAAAQELVIYEIGGGYGTNAQCILDYLQTQAPEVYARTKYTIIEISRPLAEKQLERLGPRHGSVCQVVQQDVLEWTRQRIQLEQQQQQPQSKASSPFILALEVLDNLPHDKVLWVQDEATQEWRLREAVVQGDGSAAHPYQEAHRPLSDELIALVLRVKPELGRRIDPRESQGLGKGGGLSSLFQSFLQHLSRRGRDPPRALFVPTGMAQLVDGLCKAFPRRHHFLFADFDSLPAPMLDKKDKEVEEKKTDADGDLLWALNAPLVTSRDAATGEHIDHPSYLVNKGGADIFFPVNFFLLRDLYRYLVSREDRKGGGKGYTARVVKSARFLERYGEVEGTATRSGYNPMLEDFLNTCFFIAEGKRNATTAAAQPSSSPAPK